MLYIVLFNTPLLQFNMSLMAIVSNFFAPVVSCGKCILIGSRLGNMFMLKKCNRNEGVKICPIIQWLEFKMYIAWVEI